MAVSMCNNPYHKEIELHMGGNPYHKEKGCMPGMNPYGPARRLSFSPFIEETAHTVYNEKYA